MNIAQIRGNQMLVFDERGKAEKITHKLDPHDG